MDVMTLYMERTCFPCNVGSLDMMHLFMIVQEYTGFASVKGIKGTASNFC